MLYTIKRILIFSFLNYFIKKYIRELDYNLIQKDYIKSDIIFSCNNCGFVFSNIFLIKKTENCLKCNAKLEELNNSYNI